MPNKLREPALHRGTSVRDTSRQEVVFDFGDGWGIRGWFVVKSWTQRRHLEVRYKEWEIVIDVSPLSWERLMLHGTLEARREQERYATLVAQWFMRMMSMYRGGYDG